MALLIVGLGNPGKDYIRTRHNVGFLAMHVLKETLGVSGDETNINGQKILFLQPNRFMNRSGEQVAEIAHRFHIEPKDIIVLYDEATIPFGTIRTRFGGSAGGHNGIKSLIEHLESDSFGRIRIGIGGSPDSRPLEDWVLSKFSNEELEIFFTKILPRSVDFIKERIETGRLKEHTVTVQ